MGTNTKIEWAHHTWNPWQGCHKVSPGCLNCYMERDKKRWGQDPDKVVRSSQKTFYMASTIEEAGRVFVCSWSDFFIEEADPWRREAWEVMALSPHMTFLILTKRPENIAGRLPDCWPWPMKNVWLGVTAENQEMADLRIPILLDTPAAKRFISVEPMLGPVDLFDLCATGGPGDIDWVICGCESGPGARETKLEWVADLMRQCNDANVPFFLKQIRTDRSEFAKGLVGNPKSPILVKMPMFMGRVWNQVPGEVG